MGPIIAGRGFAVLLAVALLACIPARGRAADPIAIGFADALMGGLAVVGKSGVLAAVLSRLAPSLLVARGEVS